MGKYSIKVIAGVVLTTWLFVFPAFARDHSALNGTWTLLPAKSYFAGEPVVQTGTVTIRSQDRIIIVERNFKYADSAETYFYSDVTDANNGATIHTGKDLTSKTKWDHDVLKVTTTLDGAATVESYALAVNGSMTVNVVRPGHKPIQLTFQRN
jgi:hypothetical protein